MPFTSSIVAFPRSSAFTASCNGRRSTDVGPQQATQFHAPTQRREGRECILNHCGAVCMCACHGLEQGARTQRLQTLSGCCVQILRLAWDRFNPGLRDRSAIPASVPGPVWLSATGHRACPRVRRRAQPAHPLSTTAGQWLPALLAYTQLYCEPFHKLAIATSWGSLRGRTARRQREARWVQHGQLV
jgi:hypothetical protein